MNKKIVAMGASNSIHSINKKLATWAAHQVKDAAITILDLNDYEMPIYSIDREKANGIPELAYKFKQNLIDSDGIIISFAEHNGAYSAAFKNIMDWISRIGDTWAGKPMFLMATSPGGRGGTSALDIAVNKFKFMNKNSIVNFSLPSFHKNFNAENGIIDQELSKQFNDILYQFEASLNLNLVHA
jgi:NAD(P)H-dependent FMN reductase